MTTASPNFIIVIIGTMTIAWYKLSFVRNMTKIEKVFHHIYTVSFGVYFNPVTDRLNTPMSCSIGFNGTVV